MTRAKAKRAVLVFTTKVDAAKLNDTKIRLVIKTLRGVLNERIRERGARKHAARENLKALAAQHAGTPYGAQLAAFLKPA